MESVFRERYARSLPLDGMGEGGLERLRGACVAVVGAGGLGSAVLPLLVSQFVGRIVLIDNDTVSLSNLPRQTLYGTPDVGSDKVDLAAQRLMYLNADVRVEPLKMRLSADNIHAIDEVDLLLDCTDNFDTQYLIDDYATEQSIPVVWGAVDWYAGQVAVFHGVRGTTLRGVFPEPKARVHGADAVYPPAVQWVGSVMASEAIGWLLGNAKLDGRLLQMDMKGYSVEMFEL